MRKISLILVIVSMLFMACSKENEPPQKSIDLFIWAGQSNALGRRGDAAGYPEDINNIDKEIRLNWTHIDDDTSNGWTTLGPQTGLFTEGHFGPEITFSRRLFDAGYKPAIFKYTKGATSIFEHWRGPGEGGLYDSMISNLNTAIKDLEMLGFIVNIKGFIWIQGESDSNSDQAAVAYFQNLKDIINGVRNNLNINDLPVILGVDEQYFDQPDQDQPAILNTHQTIALDDANIKFTSMYGYPKADVTHLTPLGLTQHGNSVFDTYKVLVSRNKPSSNCVLSSDGDIVSTLIKKAWGQSFSTNCSGNLSEFRFSAASSLNNSATFNIYNGADCSGDILYSQVLNSIPLGTNTISIPNVYLEKEHTYFASISSNTDTGWRVHYSDTDNVFGSLKTNRNNQNNETCRWRFLSFDLNFSVTLIE